jgi:tetratricopeptide (TPR) repeat protein
MQAIVLRKLGDALILTGDLKQARTVLEQSFRLAATADLHLSLGNLSRAEAIAHLSFSNLVPTEAVALLNQPAVRENRRQVEAVQQFMQETQSAIDLYEQAAIRTTIPETRLQAQLNLLGLLIETGRRSPAEALAAEIAPQLQQLPLSRTSVFDRIGLAQNLIKLMQSASSPTQIAQLLQTALSAS